jgi:hypothetical protein
MANTVRTASHDGGDTRVGVWGDPTLPAVRRQYSGDAVVVLLQELSTAGHLRVGALRCEEPLSFPAAYRTGIKVFMPNSGAGSPSLTYSHVLVMDAGAYPLQLTARASSVYPGSNPMCPFNCSGNLGQAYSYCGDDGCHCGVASAGARQSPQSESCIRCSLEACP